MPKSAPSFSGSVHGFPIRLVGLVGLFLLVGLIGVGGRWRGIGAAAVPGRDLQDVQRRLCSRPLRQANISTVWPSYSSSAASAMLWLSA